MCACECVLENDKGIWEKCEVHLIPSFLVDGTLANSMFQCWFEDIWLDKVQVLPY